MTTLNRAALLLFLAALAFSGTARFSGAAAAQTPSPPGQVGASAGLELDAAQKAKAEARQAQFKKDVSALGANAALTNAQKQAKYTALYQAMDKDMLAILTPAQRTQVQQQRQISSRFRTDVLALQADKTMTAAQKKARYLQLVQNARNASVALLPPALRDQAMKRFKAAEQAQQARSVKVAEARQLSQQLQKLETPAQSEKLRTIGLTTGAAIQAIIASKTLTDDAKTAKIVALRKDALSRDLALLTPAQRALYERIQALVSAPTQ